MREHRVHQFFFGRFQIHCHHVALDELSDLRADHVRAEKLPGLLVENDFDQPLVLAKRSRLAVADKGKTPDANVELLIFRRLFGQTNRGDLRRAIGATGNHQLVHRVRMQSLDRLDADDAFVLGLVRQKRRTGDVADGVDSRHVGLAGAVDDNGAALGLHAEFLQTEIFDVADNADGGDDALDGKRLYATFAIIDGGGDAVAGLVELGDLGAGIDLDALLLETFARECGDLGIFGRKYLRQHLDHRHLGSEGAVERSELNADGAGADHQQRFWHLIRDHRLEIRPNEFLVRLEPR